MSDLNHDAFQTTINNFFNLNPCCSCEARMMSYTEVAYRMFTLSLGDNLSELIKLADTVGVLASSQIYFAQHGQCPAE